VLPKVRMEEAVTAAVLIRIGESNLVAEGTRFRKPKVWPIPTLSFARGTRPGRAKSDPSMMNRSVLVFIAIAVSCAACDGSC